MLSEGPQYTTFPFTLLKANTFVSSTFLAAIVRSENSFPEYSFPTPSGINLNMMPFLVGQTWEECRLPDNCKPYWPLIQACLEQEAARSYSNMWPRKRGQSQLGRVWYLTIQESEVEGGASQRRPGLHVDSPGKVELGEVGEGGLAQKGGGSAHPFSGHDWGKGCAMLVAGGPEEEDSSWLVTRGGIFLASNVGDSCRAWDCRS